MRFNGSCVEVPTSGEAKTEPSFDANVKTSGVFIARIKRAGKKSKQLGWIELFLLENQKLALCSDSSLDSNNDPSERYLLFPLFDGLSFRQVKRHGYALTLMAPAYSIVLEAEAGDDDLAATEATKWGRILQRMTSGDQSRSSAYFKGLGISLNNLTTIPQRSKPGRKQLVPVQPSRQNMMDPPLELNTAGPGPKRGYWSDEKPVAVSTSASAPRSARPMDFDTEHNLDRAHHHSYGPAPAVSGRMASTGTSNLPHSASSKVAKRLSLGLAKQDSFSLDMGFGDDLKTVLGALDKDPADDDNTKDNAEDDAKESVKDDAKDDTKDDVKDADEKPKTIDTTAGKSQDGASEPRRTDNQVETQPTAQKAVKPDSSVQKHDGKLDGISLPAPLAPFSTPSPSSLYLTQNASGSDTSLSSSIGSGKELNRLESILVKEQQQQLDRYGSRAATMSSFDLSLPPNPPSVAPSSSTEGSPTYSNPPPGGPPPGIPPPIPDEHPVRTAKRVSIAKTSPIVQYISHEETSSDNEEDDDQETRAPLSTEAEKTHSEPATRKKNPNIVKVVKKLWSKRWASKEQHREFKGPMELLREQEEQQRQLYELPQHEAPRMASAEQVEAVEVASGEPEPEPRRFPTASSSTLAMVQEEPENEKSPLVEATHTHENSLSDDDMRQVAQAVAPATPSHATSAVPKLNSQSSISALSFRSMRSQASTSSGVTSDDNFTVKQDTVKPKLALTVQEGPKAATEPPKVTARLDPKQDSSWRQLVEEQLKASPEVAPKEVSVAEPVTAPVVPPPATYKTAPVAPMSLDPGRFTTPDRTTNPIIRKVFESGNNKSTPALSKGEGQHSASSSYSTSSSYSSLGSFKRSAQNYGSQASSLSSMSYSNSASSISAPNLVTPQKLGSLEVTMFGASLWVSKWVGAKWTPLSQLELRTDVVVTSAGIRILVMNPGGVGCIPLRFTPQCEVRRVSAHDTEVKTPENTYMFRARDPENSQKLYRTLIALQSDGAGAISAKGRPSIASVEHDRDTLDNRRRTLVPPVLSRNSSYIPKYVGMSTSTIVEE